ncbi:MAG: AAA family ATPase [Anaerolineales bacterium]|nr:AAA family ATPase [Anaerolineales bacterium]
MEKLVNLEKALPSDSVRGKKPVVIGLVGRAASGKDKVVNRLNQKFGVPIISTGDITREIAENEGLKSTRDNLQQISKKYFQKYGPEYFAQKVLERIKQESSPVVAWTGIRTPTDVQVFKEAYGERLHIIHVQVTDPRIRFERSRLRAEARDPASFEAFLRQEDAEEKIFQVHKVISMADLTISNDGSLEELYAKVDELAMRLGLSPMRRSTMA